MTIKKAILTAVSGLFLLFLSFSANASSEDGVIKVLAIGNSYSADAVENNLYDIAKADGQEMILANLFGDSLESHMENIKGDRPKYSYRKVVNGVRTITKGVKLSSVITEEDWDVITIQQVSQDAPDWDTYEPYLKELIKYVRKHMKKGARLMWHMTWAYEDGDQHSGFLDQNYGSESIRMYNDIIGACLKVHQKYGLEVIPTGSTIQNLRSGLMKGNTCRDGWHLSLTLGRYAASCTWYEAITGHTTIGNTFVPVTLQNSYRREAAQKAAHDAILHPFEVTIQPSELSPETRDNSAELSLPDPLVMNNGTPVRTKEQWINERRPEILEMFKREIYGRSAPKQEGQHYKILKEDNNAFGGLATMKEITIYFTGDESGRKMNLLLYTPNDAVGPVPAFIMMNHDGNISISSGSDISEPDEDQLKSYGVYHYPQRGQSRDRYPIPLIISRGYAFATFFNGDLDPDFDDGFKNGVQKYIYREDQTFPDPDQWGAISAWAWGYSRALDYLVEDTDVDASRVAAMGHSQGGATALWAAAQDERFAMAISNCSGCAGASVARHQAGMSVRDVQVLHPCRFCLNYLKYMGHEENLPVDQHELISLIAPRPVYVSSASLDYDSDPEGEFSGLVNAMPVYGLFGMKGLDSTEFPAPQSVIGGDHMGYHLRKGIQELYPWDWVNIIGFADKHLNHFR